jgi:hypothetical protein
MIRTATSYRKGVPISADIKGRADIPYTSGYQKISADLGQFDLVIASAE